MAKKEARTTALCGSGRVLLCSVFLFSFFLILLLISYSVILLFCFCVLFQVLDWFYIGSASGALLSCFCF